MINSYNILILHNFKLKVIYNMFVYMHKSKSELLTTANN